MSKLTKRDMKIIRIGAVCVVAIALYRFAPAVTGRWDKAKSDLEELESKLSAVDTQTAGQANVRAIVPVFEMPEAEEKQKYLFRKEFDEQLKKCGIGSQTPLQFLATRKSRRSSYKMLSVQCSAKCQFSQAMDLLANLNENPYLVGVEEFKIKCDPKKPQEVDLDLTVSTFVK